MARILDSLEMLHSPGRFSEKNLSGPTRLGLPIAIFLAFVLTRALGNFLIYQKMMGRLPENLADKVDLATLGFSFNLIALALSDLVFWVVGTGILTCINILLDGDGDYRKLLELTGLSHLPLLIFGIAVLVFSVVYTPALDFTPYAAEDLDGLRDRDPDKYERVIEGITETFRGEVRSGSILALSSAGVCCYVWLVLLVTAANARAFKLPTTRSALAMSGIVGLYLLVGWLKSVFYGTSI